MSSYLNILKKSLFSLSNSDPAPAPSQPKENPASLKSDWIYIHSEQHSTTDELINLNDTFENGNGTGNLELNNEDSNKQYKISEEMAEEIRRNREQWLKKRSSSTLKYSGAATRNIKRTKLKANARKRSSNSVNSNGKSANCDSTSLSSDSSTLTIKDTEENGCSNSEEKQVVSQKAFSQSQKLKSVKRSKLQGKYKPYSRVSSRNLQQPAAKGMC